MTATFPVRAAAPTVPGMSTSDIAPDTDETTLPLAPGRWMLDPAHSGVSFSIRHLGISKVRGRFTSFDAQLDVGDPPESTQVGATIDMASVDTNNAERDVHLRAPDYFDVATHPEMQFRSRGISRDGDRWRMEGDITVQGRTYPLTLDVDFHGTEVYFMDQTRHAGFGVTGQIRRTEVGLDFGVPTAILGDVVSFELDLQFIEPAG